VHTRSTCTRCGAIVPAVDLDLRGHLEAHG
jgi:hypothetical protein